MRRRQWVFGLSAACVVRAGAADDPLVSALRAGGVAVLLRHALTDPGVGDPPGFRAGVCSTQRQLSAEGRRQAQRIGEWFHGVGLAPARVRTSAWCRCIDTASLAFGQAEPWSALNSFFEDRARADGQGAAMRAALARIGAGRFEVWVTHQVNISAFNGEGVAMGEGWVVRMAPDSPARVHNLGRLRFDT